MADTKKAIKEAGKKWIERTVESAKRIKKSLSDPLGTGQFVKDIKSSRKKQKRSESKIAQRTGNKYMIGKKTIVNKPKVKRSGKQVAKKYFKGSF